MYFVLNPFARRQTAQSRFSHFGGSEGELIELVRANWERRQPGNRDGVVLVPVNPNGFYSGVVQVTPETVLRATFSARREGEAPFINVVAIGGNKLPAKAVDIVLYRSDILGSDATPGVNGLSTDVWEVVSINARTTEGPEPMNPLTMARNMLGLEGGTPADYTARQFAEAILFWADRAMQE